MEITEFFKWLAIFSPIVSGIIVGIVTHKLSNRSKRIDILYQNKIRAFHEFHKILINYRFELEPSIYNNPFLERSFDAKGSVETLNILNNAFVSNSIYLNKESTKAVMDLMTKINFFCGFNKHDFENINPYLDMAVEVNKVVNILYKDLNLK
ncbi:hypothetical protein Q765_11910 [Flavobacterium rivuli WB 3.3-2 = DSM 21788]|uniref:Uncharacterized protein n=1 Tax=Flavobacterium rivuli WB 3.3-2 = DSM 21788 TaxID=1121895 RepID=A0A0A2M4B1_9FLAO|nr:hypothetical protein [Flavobacterium rivuli]KGO86278.1 hypothetical protein Q765_11910 [Flavobacterium rivuli WB 3.3-2 = DSM 21788]